MVNHGHCEEIHDQTVETGDSSLCWNEMEPCSEKPGPNLAVLKILQHHKVRKRQRLEVLLRFSSEELLV